MDLEQILSLLKTFGSDGVLLIAVIWLHLERKRLLLELTDTKNELKKYVEQTFEREKENYNRTQRFLKRDKGVSTKE